MRSQGSKDQMLLAVAKKKPQLQALIDNVGNMTDQEIEALPQALWIRQALAILKKSDGKGQKERIQDIVNRVIAAEEAALALPPKTYEVRLWDCASDYIGHGSGMSNNKFSYEIHPQDTFMLLEDDDIKIGSTVLHIGPFDMHSLFLRSKLIGYMTKENYIGFHQALLNQKHKL